MNMQEQLANLSTLQEKQEFFLDDMTSHYNADNRGLTEYGLCSYRDGCAIGRWITPELASEFDGDDDNSSVDSTHIFEQLPEWMQELGVLFLKKIQSLHDDEDSWNEKGLSEDGKESVSNIKHMFHLQ